MKPINCIKMAFCPLVLLMSCTASKKTTQPEGSQAGSLLYANEWKLTELQGEPVSADSRAYLAFANDAETRVTGHTGCNRLNGSVVLTGASSIKFGPAAVTRMACLDGKVAETESKLLAAINKAESWSVKDGVMQLSDGTTVLAKFKAQKPLTAAEALLNGAWELTYIAGPKIAFDGLFPNKKPTIVFDLPKDQVSGNGGCNGYSAKAMVNGTKLTFGDALSTMMACEGNGEPLYFKTLKTVTGYRFEDDNKTLLMLVNELPVLKFVKK
ncbi:MAG: hypothetical protein RL172_320 [Bacteroidota bacterium]|jgi:heat shock protein HslJ